MQQWTGAAVRPLGAVDLGACFSAPSPACFTEGQTRSSVLGAEPVTGPPINLSANVNGTTVTLTWTQPAFQDAPVISYVIEVGSAANFVAPDLLSVDTFSTATTLQAAGVAFGTYHVRVRARNALGVSVPSNEIQVVVGAVAIPVPGCPGAPRSLTGAGSVGTVTLSWLPPLNGGAQSYMIEAGSSSGAANLAAFNNGPSTTFVRAGVPPGVYLHPCARCGCGLSVQCGLQRSGGYGLGCGRRESIRDVDSRIHLQSVHGRS